MADTSTAATDFGTSGSATPWAQRGLIPPTIHDDEPDPSCPLNAVASARKQRIGAALKNSFGFGGTNSSVVFRRHDG
jgi:3-oxoacyl-(acyl-carrier-protein) synthase